VKRIGDEDRAMPTLLVVEDERKLAESLRRGLSNEGFDVVTAASGEED
jgi:DNA-binding response OmpR family regulator